MENLEKSGDFTLVRARKVTEIVVRLLVLCYQSRDENKHNMLSKVDVHKMDCQ